MKMNPKHKSKLHKGFEKQVKRQDTKPSFSNIQLYPIVLSYDDGEYKPLCKTVFNNKWNGMNLKNICNSFLQVQPDWMHSKVNIRKDGKYILSLRGKQILKKKRAANK